MKNPFSEGEVEVYNTVAELVGQRNADEVVIIGGHLDSWDLGTGATDNGTGTMAVLEAARALKAVGVQPRRTIRFVLFAGEEEGRHGSLAYAKAHDTEMPKVSAVLIQDMGTGRARTIGLQGRYDLREVMDHVIAPFKEALGLEELSMRKTRVPTTFRSALTACRPSPSVRTWPTTARRTTPRAIPSTRFIPTRSTRGPRCWLPGPTTSPSCRRSFRASQPAHPGMFDSP